MQGERFDRWKRTPGAGSVRRTVLRALGGALGVAAVGRRGDDAAAAGCKRRRRGCSTKSQCCGSQTKHVTCRRGACSSPGATVCCGVAQARCGSLCDCCAGFECVGDTETQTATCVSVA